MLFLFKYWPIILSLLGGIGAVVGGLALSHDSNISNKRTWPIWLIFIGTTVQFIGSFASNYYSDSQQDSIQSTAVRNSQISKETKELDIKIKALQDINNEIAKNTNGLVEENKKTTEKNLQLSQNAKQIIAEGKNVTVKVNDLLKQVHNEITGANSIPFVSARIYFNYANPNGYDKVTEFDNKWCLDFTIQNIGNYPLNNIRTFLSKASYRNHYDDDKELPTIAYLQVSETRRLVPLDILDSPSMENSGRFQTLVYSIRVKWKIEYIYNVFIDLGINNYQIKDSYFYMGVKYATANNLKEAIQKDLNE